MSEEILENEVDEVADDADEENGEEDSRVDSFVAKEGTDAWPENDRETNKGD